MSEPTKALRARYTLFEQGPRASGSTEGPHALVDPLRTRACSCGYESATLLADDMLTGALTPSNTAFGVGLSSLRARSAPKDQGRTGMTTQIGRDLLMSLGSRGPRKVVQIEEGVMDLDRHRASPSGPLLEVDVSLDPVEDDR